MGLSPYPCMSLPSILFLSRSIWQGGRSRSPRRPRLVEEQGRVVICGPIKERFGKPACSREDRNRPGPLPNPLIGAALPGRRFSHEDEPPRRSGAGGG